MLLLIGSLLVMFPGAVTGSSTACVLTTGALVVPVLMAMGLDKLRTGAFIAMAAIYGMAPPVNIRADRRRNRHAICRLHTSLLAAHRSWLS